jgi:hypothetical protein
MEREHEAIIVTVAKAGSGILTAAGSAPQTT